MKLTTLIFILTATITFAFAQQSNVRGTVIDLDNNVSVAGVNITLTGEQYFETTSDSNGIFQFTNIPFGKYELKTVKEGYEAVTIQLKLDEAEENLGNFILYATASNSNRPVQDNIPVVSLSESDLDEQTSQDVSALLSASEGFITNRGYDGENFTTLLNGAPMNDLITGRTYWGLWGGLNDVTRSRENSLWLAPSTFSIGGIGGSVDLDCRAARQRKQISVSYAVTNRSYLHRLMATYSTGLLKKNWAVSFSFSKRWAKEGYIPGTTYDGYSYFASLEKLIGLHHSVSFTTFAAPTKTGSSTPAVQEMNDLAGTNYYNPNWGYQNGEKRNARVRKTFQPVFLLNHEWKTDNSTLETAVSYLFGKNSVSGLDWYNAPDPRPDYYRRLPSLITDSTLQNKSYNQLSFSEDARQINWDNLYQVNYNNVETVANGTSGDSITGKRSLYIIQNRVINNSKLAVNSVYNNSITDFLKLTIGASYQRQTSDYYQEVGDLLGGDFFLDLNQFAEQDFPDNQDAAQNDLNNPNGVAREGDKYGYNYSLTNSQFAAWAQTQFKFNKIDFFVAGEFSSIKYWRKGKTKVGLFPNTSFGESEKKQFFNYHVKGGLTYKITGRHYLFVNGSAISRAPSIADALVAPRTRNQFAEDLKNASVYSGEAGYYLKSPKVKGRITGFFTEFNDQVQTYTFYHDDLRTLVNYTLRKVDTRHMGIELALQGKLYKGLSAYAVASFGQYIYTSRPVATITQDNNQEVLQNQTIYAKNFFVSGTPQKVYSVGLSYRGKKFWFVDISFNILDDTYISFNPARRTQQAVDLVTENSDQWNSIIEQEEVNKEFKNKYTLDFFGGRSFKLTDEKVRGYHWFAIINVGISNLTNNKNLITGGYEQLRFDFADKNPDKFAPRYFYDYGATFFVNLTFRLN